MLKKRGRPKGPKKQNLHVKVLPKTKKTIKSMASRDRTCGEVLDDHFVKFTNPQSPAETL